jgi:hypothetical protein
MAYGLKFRIAVPGMLYLPGNMCYVIGHWKGLMLFRCFFYKKLETRYKKQEGEAPAAPILACLYYWCL